MHKMPILRHVLTYIVIIVTLVCNILSAVRNEHHLLKLTTERIEDTHCCVKLIDHFNNYKIYPRMKSLLLNDYFRFYKVNLNQQCPFWKTSGRCTMKYCHVEPCDKKQTVLGLLAEPDTWDLWTQSKKRTKDPNEDESFSDYNNELSYLNTTISADTYKEFELWQKYDDIQDHFCVDKDNNRDAQYVDLLLNPERYTGYKGPAAHRIWNSIYMENCFNYPNGYTSYMETLRLHGLCAEKKMFYRVLSGIHSSINIHLCANYLLSERRPSLRMVGTMRTTAHWGPNFLEFERKFNPLFTDNEGPQWLRNLYFVYLLELRAIAKITDFLNSHKFYTGNIQSDIDVQLGLKDLLQVINSFPKHFNEKSLFNSYARMQLKEQFREKFKNITRIIDCVTCDKCKLWGKLQVQGLGTAFKILFSRNFDTSGYSINNNLDLFALRREEIVSLINGFGRLSTSIFELEQFRNRIYYNT